ncbi:Protein of unknown function [Variovorax sp. YR750]|nr:Protein of unknown function [Variovorax sp. YR750]
MPQYDYYVSAVDYNSDETHIAKLRVHPIKADGKFSLAGELMTRPQIVELIGKKKTFCTIFQKVDKSWKEGAKLEIFPVTTNYLKTKKDSSERDNLENLPRI